MDKSNNIFLIKLNFPNNTILLGFMVLMFELGWCCRNAFEEFALYQMNHEI